MSDTLNDRINAHLAKARAAAGDRWLASDIDVMRSFSVYRVVRGEEGNDTEAVAEAEAPFANAAHIAANDPATIEALCAVAKADDPEPPKPGFRRDDTSHIFDARLYDKMQRQWNAWRKRQELKAALYDALGKE